jgi:hypothetical protein
LQPRADKLGRIRGGCDDDVGHDNPCVPNGATVPLRRKRDRGGMTEGIELLQDGEKLFLRKLARQDRVAG